MKTALESARYIDIDWLKLANNKLVLNLDDLINYNAKDK